MSQTCQQRWLGKKQGQKKKQERLDRDAGQQHWKKKNQELQLTSKLFLMTLCALIWLSLSFACSEIIVCISTRVVFSSILIVLSLPVAARPIFSECNCIPSILLSNSTFSLSLFLKISLNPCDSTTRFEHLDRMIVHASAKSCWNPASVEAVSRSVASRRAALSTCDRSSSLTSRSLLIWSRRSSFFFSERTRMKN